MSRAAGDELRVQTARVERARTVLTDVEYLTWAMAEIGLSQRAIADYRRVSRSTVRDCLERVEGKLGETEEDA